MLALLKLLRPGQWYKNIVKNYYHLFYPRILSFMIW